MALNTTSDSGMWGAAPVTLAGWSPLGAVAWLPHHGRSKGMFQLNHLFGAVGQGAAALERCCVAEDYGGGLAGRQAR